MPQVWHTTSSTWYLKAAMYMAPKLRKRKRRNKKLKIYLKPIVKLKDDAQRKRYTIRLTASAAWLPNMPLPTSTTKCWSRYWCRRHQCVYLFDQTVYVNEIPSNQVENWLKIEAERFLKPVLRLSIPNWSGVWRETADLTATTTNSGSHFFRACLKITPMATINHHWYHWTS